MRKIFGLAVAAALPVACGIHPTAPDAPAFVPQAAEATFTASGRGRPIQQSCNTEPDWSQVHGVVLNAIAVRKTGVMIRAELVVISGGDPAPCFSPTFSLRSRLASASSASLVSGLDPQEVTLVAPPGRYEVVASAKTHDHRDLWGSIVVDVASPRR